MEILVILILAIILGFIAGYKLIKAGNAIDRFSKYRRWANDRYMLIQKK
mgnify:CR=1 FL=1